MIPSNDGEQGCAQRHPQSPEERLSPIRYILHLSKKEVGPWESKPTVFHVDRQAVNFNMVVSSRGVVNTAVGV